MFETHKLNERGFKEVEKLKRMMTYAVDNALPLIPEGREKAIFKTKLEEGMFFATRAIAADPMNYTEIIDYKLQKVEEINHVTE